MVGPHDGEEGVTINFTHLQKYQNNFKYYTTKIYALKHFRWFDG